MGIKNPGQHIIVIRSKSQERNPHLPARHRQGRGGLGPVRGAGVRSAGTIAAAAGCTPEGPRLALHRVRRGCAGLLAGGNGGGGRAGRGI